MEFVPHAGELFLEKMLRKSLVLVCPSCWGVILDSSKNISVNELVCPPCGGVIPLINTKTIFLRGLSPVWGELFLAF